MLLHYNTYWICISQFLNEGIMMIFHWAPWLFIFSLSVIFIRYEKGYILQQIFSLS